MTTKEASKDSRYLVSHRSMPKAYSEDISSRRIRFSLCFLILRDKKAKATLFKVAQITDKPRIFGCGVFFVRRACARTCRVRVPVTT